MIQFSQLEQIAADGGYSIGKRQIGRITVADVHRLHASLARMSGGAAQEAALAAARLRRWIVHGDGRLPPVRGAGYVHANREVWMSYTDSESPAVLRAKPSVLDELRRCLALSSNPDYRGHLRVKTNPVVEVGMDGEAILFTSKAGVVRLNMSDATRIDHWISITIQPRDRLGILCLPSPWSAA